MRVLLLGSSGFLGRHLAAELCARGDAVEGWSRVRGDVDRRVLHRTVDLLERASFAEFAGPWDAAVLLAGHTVPGAGFDHAKGLANESIARNALDHLVRTSTGARVVVLSSAQVYARGTDETLPAAGSGGSRADEPAIVEDHPLSPHGEYGLSKLRIEQLARGLTSRLDIVIARSFNQIGPAQPRGLLVPDLLQALARGQGPIRMRGMDGVRDFIDVRDGARAIADLVARRGTSGGADGGARGEAFNVCTGRAVRVSEIAHGLARRLDVQREIVFEPGTAPRLVGSPEKLVRATGWKPRFTLAETLDWIAEASRSA